MIIIYLQNFRNNRIEFNILKGNLLNEINEVKKGDGTPFKVFTPYWRNAEKFYLEKIPPKEKKISKCKKKTSFFENTINEKVRPNFKSYKINKKT